MENWSLLCGLLSLLVPVIFRFTDIHYLLVLISLFLSIEFVFAPMYDL